MAGKGVAAIQLSAIPTLGLQFIIDDDTHGRIVGIPFADTDEDWNLQTELAERLLQLSHVTLVRWNRRP